MFRTLKEFPLYEMDENKVIRHIKTQKSKSPHRGGTDVRLYTKEGKEKSRKIDKLYDATFPEKLPGVSLAAYPKYRILDNGAIYSLSAASFLKPAVTNDGYLQVSLQKSIGGYSTELVHRVVAKAYLTPEVGYAEVNHIDGDKANNTIANLEWCTREQNIQHSYDKKLKIPKYRKCVVYKDRNAEKIGFASLKEAAIFLHVSGGAVSCTAQRNYRNDVPTRGTAKQLGKFLCAGYVVEYDN